MPPWSGRSCARLLSGLLVLQLALSPFGPGPLAVRPEPVEGRIAALRPRNAERAGLTRELGHSLTGLEEPGAAASAEPAWTIAALRTGNRGLLAGVPHEPCVVRRRASGKSARVRGRDGRGAVPRLVPRPH